MRDVALGEVVSGTVPATMFGPSVTSRTPRETSTMPMSTATAMAVGLSIRGRVGGAVPGPSVKAPSVKERFAQDDAVAYGSTPAEFATFIKQEQARWSEVVKKAKLKAD